MIGRNVEIIIFAEPEKKSGEKDRMSKDVYNSVFSNENRQLLESINSVYADDMQDTEEQMIHTGMRRYHRHLITENGQW